MIEPHFQVTGAKKSEQLEVVSVANGTVKVRHWQGTERELRLEESNKWSLYARQTNGLAIGDQVRVTKNHLIGTAQAGEDGKPVSARMHQDAGGVRLQAPVATPGRHLPFQDPDRPDVIPLETELGRVLHDQDRFRLSRKPIAGGLEVSG